MKGKRIVLSFAVMAMTVAGGAAANEIYKWTDAEGNVHYEDRPTADAPIERLAIASRNTDNSVVHARLEERRKARATAEQVASEAPPEMSREEIRAEQEKRQERCEMYRARLDSFVNSQRLYREDDAGERVYLEEKEILAARTRVEGQIKEYCG